jgi:DHA1 family bicyclomycin/chloramphenicol resistance-like MFS transporter
VRRLGIIVILGALTAFGPMAIDIYLPAFPDLTAHFRAPEWEIQLTLTACLAGLAVGQVLAGPVSDALGRRGPLLVGVAAFSITSALCAVAPSVPVLTGLRFVQGLGGAAGVVIARAVVRDLYEGVALARAFSLLMLVNGLAPILAPLLGSEVLRYTSWTGLFWVLTGYGVALLLAVALGLRETLPADRRRRGGLRDSVHAFGTLGRDRAFLGYALAGGLVFAAMFAYISGSPFVTQEIYGVSPTVFGVIFGVNALGIVLASQLNGALLGRFSAGTLLSAALAMNLAGAAGVLAAVLSPVHSIFWLLPPLFLVVSSIGSVMPNTAALALDAHPEAAGTASALLGLLQFVFGAAAAPLVGLGGASTALPMAIVIAAVSVAAILTRYLLVRPSRGPVGEPQPAPSPVA